MVLILAMTACSSQQTVPLNPDARTLRYQTRMVELGGVPNWKLEARLAVNDGKDGGSGHFNWARQSRSNQMDFHGALGRGAWRLEADDSEAVLELADGEVFRAATVSELIEAQIGWQIPVEALEWWVRGLEAPGETQQVELDEQGLLVRLSQFGWNVEYGRYKEADSVMLPHKMTARRDNQSVKLAVRNWSLGTQINGD